MIYKLILVSIFSTFLFCNSSQKKTKEKIEFNLLKDEADYFIKLAKDNSLYKGKHNVYALKINYVDSGIAITIGYIDSEIEIEALENCRYHFYTNNELVLVDFPVLSQENILLNNSLLVPIKSSEFIADKINHKGVFLGTYLGYVCFFGKDKTLKKVFENEDSIPPEISVKKRRIYRGTTTQLDSASFNSLLGK